MKGVGLLEKEVLTQTHVVKRCPRQSRMSGGGKLRAVLFWQVTPLEPFIEDQVGKVRGWSTHRGLNAQLRYLDVR